MLRLPGQRTSIRRSDITDKWYWLGRLDFGKARQTSTQCRRRSEGQWPGSARLKRPWRRHRRGSHLRAHALAAGLERAVGEAPHDPRRHDYRSAGGGSEDCGFLGGSGFLDVVRQLCTLESLQGTAFLGSHQAASCLWQVGGWSLWYRNVLVMLVSRGIWTQDRLARLRGEDDDSCSSATKAQAPCSTAATSTWPCRQSDSCTFRRRCDRRHVLLSRNTGNSSQTAFSLVHPQFCQQVHSSSHAQRCGTTDPQADTFSQWRAATSRLGCGGGRQCGELQSGCAWGCSVRRIARADLARWRGLRSGHGRAHHLGHAHAAHRLRRYHRDRQRAKVQSLGCWENRLLVSHDQVKAIKVKGHATQRDVEAGRTSHLFKRGNDYAEGPRLVTVQGLGRHRRGSAAPPSGLVCDWLSLTVPSRFSRDGHLDPRTFRGHSLQLGRVSDSGGRPLGRAIIFCAKCGWSGVLGTLLVEHRSSAN